MGEGSGKWVAGAVAIVTIASAPVWARYVGFFDVRQVEVVGTRYLDPGSIVAQMHLDPGRSVFERIGPLEDIVAGIAGVRAVEIERRLPATLMVAIVERQPVALVPGPGGMIALDAEARPLPYDPANVLLDLPIAAASERRLTRVMALVRSVDASMYGELVGARMDDAGAVVLEFADHEVLLPVHPDAGAVLAVTAVRRHLEVEGGSFDRLDARFDGMVVARRART